VFILITFSANQWRLTIKSGPLFLDCLYNNEFFLYIDMCNFVKQTLVQVHLTCAVTYAPTPAMDTYVAVTKQGLYPVTIGLVQVGYLV